MLKWVKEILFTFIGIMCISIALVIIAPSLSFWNGFFATVLLWWAMLLAAVVIKVKARDFRL